MTIMALNKIFTPEARLGEIPIYKTQNIQKYKRIFESDHITYKVTPMFKKMAEVPTWQEVIKEFKYLVIKYESYQSIELLFVHKTLFTHIQMAI